MPDLRGFVRENPNRRGWDWRLDESLTSESYLEAGWLEVARGDAPTEAAAQAAVVRAARLVNEDWKEVPVARGEAGD